MDEKTFYRKIMLKKVVDKEQLLSEIKKTKTSAKRFNFRATYAIAAAFIVIIGITFFTKTMNTDNPHTKSTDKDFTAPYADSTSDSVIPKAASYKIGIEEIFSQSELVFTGKVTSTKDGICKLDVIDIIKGELESDTIQVHDFNGEITKKYLIFAVKENEQYINNLNTTFVYNEINGTFWSSESPDELFSLSDFLQ